MTHSRKARNIRGPLTAGLLIAAVAGCGTQVATGATSGGASSAGAKASSGNSASTESTTTAAGCADVNQATKVTVIRAMHLVEPTRIGALDVTQTDPATVRALFRDFCQVIAHKSSSHVIMTCPNEIGLSYGGTFYAGNRPLASYTFAASGCEVVTVTAANQPANTRTAVVMGTAAAAAPDLHTDMDKALGLSDAQVFQPQGPQTQVNQGSGASKAQ